MKETKSISIYDSPQTYNFFNFIVKMLKLLRLWGIHDGKPKSCWDTILKYSFAIIIIPNSIPCLYDFFAMISEDDTTAAIFFQSLLALVCILGEHYAAMCFLSNKKAIKKLVERLSDFKKFSSFESMIETDKKAVFYTKLLLFYSTMASSIYVGMPLISKESCDQNRTPSMIKHGIPCGMVCRVRLPVHYDYSPFYEFMYLHQVFIALVLSWVMITLTMLLCGLVVHITHHLRMLRKQLNEVSDCSPGDVRKNVKTCVLYHTEIIQYCVDINAAFGSQMVLHITLTSFIISILGFMLMVVNMLDFLRFTLHLAGWLFLLLIACYSGQSLIDESVAIGREVYDMSWYNFPIDVQRDLKFVLARSQKPLTLKALDFGIMSFESFLMVMKSAYSYLTMLINIKQ